MSKSDIFPHLPVSTFSVRYFFLMSPDHIYYALSIIIDTLERCHNSVHGSLKTITLSLKYGTSFSSDSSNTLFACVSQDGLACMLSVGE